jgi:lincosamide nucleotidyltransferase A/C/D/E
MSEPRAVETKAEDVARLIDDLIEASIDWWIAGGWGIDALVGYQTRPHRDVDIIVPLARVLAVHGLLLGQGFAVGSDWFPVRFEMIHPDGRAVDVHPIRLDANGGGRLELEDGEWWTFDAEALSGRGSIGGRTSPCLSPAEQVRCHTGYEPGETDRSDLKLLASRFAMVLPPQYR